jgi:hypothetical protein
VGRSRRPRWERTLRAHPSLAVSSRAGDRDRTGMASLEGRALRCPTFTVQTLVQVNTHVGVPLDTARDRCFPVVRARGGHKARHAPRQANTTTPASPKARSSAPKTMQRIRAVLKYERSETSTRLGSFLDSRYCALIAGPTSLTNTDLFTDSPRRRQPATRNSSVAITESLPADQRWAPRVVSRVRPKLPRPRSTAQRPLPVAHSATGKSVTILTTVSRGSRAS